MTGECAVLLREERAGVSAECEADEEATREMAKSKMAVFRDKLQPARMRNGGSR